MLSLDDLVSIDVLVNQRGNQFGCRSVRIASPTRRTSGMG